MSLLGKFADAFGSIARHDTPIDSVTAHPAVLDLLEKRLGRQVVHGSVARKLGGVKTMWGAQLLPNVNMSCVRFKLTDSEGKDHYFDLDPAELVNKKV